MAVFQYPIDKRGGDDVAHHDQLFDEPRKTDPLGLIMRGQTWDCNSLARPVDAPGCRRNCHFGERPQAGGALTADQTAAIGSWQNKNGQRLIRFGTEKGVA
jgi:hypothetical protein